MHVQLRNESLLYAERSKTIPTCHFLINRLQLIFLHNLYVYFISNQVYWTHFKFKKVKTGNMWRHLLALFENMQATAYKLKISGVSFLLHGGLHVRLCVVIESLIIKVF